MIRQQYPQTSSSEERPAVKSSFAATMNPSQFKQRASGALKIMVIIVLILVLRLVWVQIIKGPEFSDKAQSQRVSVLTEPAHRGTVYDRNMNELAYTMEARSLSVHPNTLEKYITERHKLYDTPEYDERLPEIASGIEEIISESDEDADISAEDMMDKLTSSSSYEVLVRNVDPDVAYKIVDEFPEITAERQDIRQYPNGAVGESVIGKISMDQQGQFGLELSQDNKLQGVNGSRTVDLSIQGQVIPGSTRNVQPAINGDTITLTLDLDAQSYVQQQVEQAKRNSGAESASAVVLDAHTGEVIAMAQSDTINPNGDIDQQLSSGKEFGNTTVSTPFEPGSVAKVVTAAAAINEGLTTPDEVLTVPGTISLSGVQVKDAWQHGNLPFTTTGIFGKSSNVGTLMLAERVGEEKYYDYLQKFGVGQLTNIELPSESAGMLPQFNQWSGGTFANLPIGQGMSVTLLQMTSIFQTIANEGERIQPRIIKEIVDADESQKELDEPEKVQVITPETAHTVLEMFQSVFQDDPTGVNRGTAGGDGIVGYQLSGKTGTAQQVDPNTGAYSNSMYWITFAGVAPADNPKFVIGVMLDKPQRGVHGQGGQSAAPLFTDISNWMLNHYNVPPSPQPSPYRTLEAH